jgi:hypothetical protein
MEDTKKGLGGTIAPLVLLVGDLLSKLLSYAEHLDFLLSIRDAKFATMFQVFTEYAWWIIALCAGAWTLYEWKRKKDDSSAGALVFSSAFVAFLLGVIITVKATGSLPEVVQMYTADAINGTCSASIDTSRLEGFKDDYRVILICGVGDPSLDAQEDDRISVSSAFHITGTVIAVTGKFGKMVEVWKDVHPPTGQAAVVQVWHSVALMPKDGDLSTIKRVSDVAKQGGRFITPPASAYGNSLLIPNLTPAGPLPVAPKKPAKS